MASTKHKHTNIGLTCKLSRRKRANARKPVTNTSFQSDAEESLLENDEKRTTVFRRISKNDNTKKGSSENDILTVNAAPYNPYIEQSEASDYSRRVIMCPFNCVCCINYQLGKSCACYAQHESVAVQTSELDFLRMKSETIEYFTRGSLAHSVMQKYIINTIEQYDLKSKKDLLFGRAVIDVVNSFPDLDSSSDTKNQVSNRMAKAIRWKKFSLKRKQKTASNSIINEEESQATRKQRSTDKTIIKKELESQGKRTSTQSVSNGSLPKRCVISSSNKKKNKAKHSKVKRPRRGVTK
ncbi:uncharacterized protein LOC127704450 [Mytilus californianus]|uniref:uncharacterized protein LOC127704450 n=1 Tax=Mytilus californianus TaxID=6549 RepID=UPI0022464DDB|nr:uncharacterized protein LOC127704450 [Mytilus californianus]